VNTRLPPQENLLIQALPAPQRKHLLNACEPLDVVLSQVLCKPGERLSHAYFPQTGFLSLVVEVDNHPGLEVGMIGREGMMGSELALGMDTMPWRALAQGAGRCLRMEAGTFCRQVAASAELQHLVHRYQLVRLHQLARAAACERFHLIGPRLARWLLMSQDRARTHTFHVTHEFIALMLGVRRVGVTVAAGALQRGGLIEYHRGEVTVLKRPELEGYACSCYAADKASYNDLMQAQT
jgi:CRP-like cAMP-binding protein